VIDARTANASNRTYGFYEARIRVGARLRDGVRRRCGQLVRLADHEGLEGVAVVERRRSGGRFLAARDGLTRRDEEIHLRAPLAIFLDAEHHRGGLAEHTLRRPCQHAGMFRLVPLHSELVGGADNKPSVVQCDRLGGLEPRAHGRVGKFAARLFQHALPGFFCGLLHLRSKWVGVSKGSAKL